MPASAFDSAIYSGLFGDEETAALFSETAEVAAMLRVEGALAKVQGELGLIPAESAAFLEKASREIRLDPADLAAAAAVDGVPVPGLVSAFRAAMAAPEHARWLHWGATSQDVMDTASALRLRRATEIWTARLEALIGGLAVLARAHADLPMAARTYGQAATPTSFGAVAAGWGRPLLRWRARLEALKLDLEVVSLGGAAGTLSAMGPRGPEVRAALAKALDLGDPGASWHAERDRIGAFAAWAAGLCVSLGKMGEDLILMTQSGIGEIRIAGAGGSSTMPQKQNPVGPAVLSALARQAAPLAAAISGAGLHRQQRDGAAWFVEWLTLPQLCLSTGRALALACDLTGKVSPDPEAMRRGLDEGFGLIRAEAWSFALARVLPRPEAQAKIKALCAEALARRVPLEDLTARDFPGLALAEAETLGAAPQEARAFAEAAARI